MLNINQRTIYSNQMLSVSGVVFGENYAYQNLQANWWKNISFKVYKHNVPLSWSC